MSAMSAVGDPGAAAEMAAEAVRTLNHLTLVPPSVGTPGWEDVADLYRVLTELRVLTGRLPQAIGQVARHLERSMCAGYRCDSAATASAGVLVSTAIEALTLAGAAASECAAKLRCRSRRRGSPCAATVGCRLIVSIVLPTREPTSPDGRRYSPPRSVSLAPCTVIPGSAWPGKRSARESAGIEMKRTRRMPGGTPGG